MKRALCIAVMLFASLASAQQSNYSLKSYGTVDANCLEAKNIAIWYLNQIETHHELVTIVCSDTDFDAFTKRVKAHSGNAVSIQLKKDEPYLVFIRARSLLGDTRLNSGFTPQHIIAHEFGHINGDTVFEELAERVALRLMSKMKPYQIQH